MSVSLALEVLAHGSKVLRSSLHEELEGNWLKTLSREALSVYVQSLCELLSEESPSIELLRNFQNLLSGKWQNELSSVELDTFTIVYIESREKLWGVYANILLSLSDIQDSKQRSSIQEIALNCCHLNSFPNLWEPYNGILLSRLLLCLESELRYLIEQEKNDVIDNVTLENITRFLFHLLSGLRHTSEMIEFTEKLVSSLVYVLSSRKLSMLSIEQVYMVPLTRLQGQSESLPSRTECLGFLVCEILLYLTQEMIRGWASYVALSDLATQTILSGLPDRLKTLEQEYSERDLITSSLECWLLAHSWVVATHLHYLVVQQYVTRQISFLQLDPIQAETQGKCQFIDLLTPGTGLGVLNFPLQEIFKLSKLVFAWCAKELIWYCTKWKQWWRPSGPFRLHVRMLFHLACKSWAGTTSSQEQSSKSRKRSFEEIDKHDTTEKNVPGKTKETFEWHGIGMCFDIFRSLINQLESESLETQLRVTVRVQKSSHRLPSLSSVVKSAAGDWKTAILDPKALKAVASSGSDTQTSIIDILEQLGVSLSYSIAQIVSSTSTLPSHYSMKTITRRIQLLFQGISEITRHCEAYLNLRESDLLLLSGASIFTKEQFEGYIRSHTELPPPRLPLLSFSTLEHLQQILMLVIQSTYELLVFMKENRSCFCFESGSDNDKDSWESDEKRLTLLFSGWFEAWRVVHFSLAHVLLHDAARACQQNVIDARSNSTPSKVDDTLQCKGTPSPIPFQYTLSLAEESPNSLSSVFLQTQISEESDEQVVLFTPYIPAEEQVLELVRGSVKVRPFYINLHRLSPISNRSVQIISTISSFQQFYASSLSTLVVSPAATIASLLWWFSHRLSSFATQLSPKIHDETITTLRELSLKLSLRCSELPLTVAGVCVVLTIFAEALDKPVFPQSKFPTFVNQHRVNMTILGVIQKRSVNSLIEAGMLPTLLSFLFQFISHQLSLCHLKTSTQMLQSQTLLQVTTFLSQVLERVAQMTPPSSSQPLTQDSFMSVLAGVGTLLCLPILLSIHPHPSFGCTLIAQLLPWSTERIVNYCITSRITKVCQQATIHNSSNTIEAKDSEELLEWKKDSLGYVESSYFQLMKTWIETEQLSSDMIDKSTLPPQISSLFEQIETIPLVNLIQDDRLLEQDSLKSTLDDILLKVVFAMNHFRWLSPESEEVDSQLYLRQGIRRSVLSLAIGNLFMLLSLRTVVDRLHITSIYQQLIREAMMTCITALQPFLKYPLVLQRLFSSSFHFTLPDGNSPNVLYAEAFQFLLFHYGPIIVAISPTDENELHTFSQQFTSLTSDTQSILEVTLNTISQINTEA